MLDGAIQVDRLVARAVELGQTAIAITDHGWIAGAVKLTQACQESGILPIIGSEVYVATGSDMKQPAKNAGDNFHLTLLAATPGGYRNLMRLTSLAALEGMSYKPRLDWSTLAAHSEGLILMSGCIAAELPQAIIYGGETKARDVLRRFQSVFGERFFIELMSHGSTGGIDHVRVTDENDKILMLEHELNDALVSLADRYGISIVATNDAHYMTRDDGFAHDTLLCLGTGGWRGKAGRLKFAGYDEGAFEFYVKSEAEMRTASDAPFWQRAVDGTADVVKLITGPVLNLGAAPILPRFEIPDDPGFRVFQRTGLLV